MGTKPALNSTPEDQSLRPGIGALIGLGIIAVTAHEVYRLWLFEQDGEAIKVNAFLAMLYRLGGKWMVALFFGGLGIFMLVGGVWLWLSPTPKKEATESSPSATSRDRQAAQPAGKWVTVPIGLGTDGKAGVVLTQEWRPIEG